MSAPLPDAAAQRLKTNFPPSFGYDGLSLLLNRTPQSLMADRCRKPWTLPPACDIPGAKSPLWLLNTVLDWLAQHQQPATPAPAVQELSPKPRKRGRPTKIEQRTRAQQCEGGAQ